MAKCESFEYCEDWLELESLPWTGEVTAAHAASLTTAKKFRVSIEVAGPGDVGLEKFNPLKSVVIKQFKAKWQKTVAELFSSNIESKLKEMDEPSNSAKNKKEGASLDSLNKSIEKSFADFRLALKKATIAFLETVNDDNKVKIGDLTTISNIDFKPLEWIGDKFEVDTNDNSELLEIGKSLKRKKWQYCAVAWKNKEGVLSIRLKKQFKANEMKELRDCLPDGSRQGANWTGGRILAFSETKVQFEFPANLKPPIQALKNAFKEQLGKSVFVDKKFGVWDPNAPDDTTENEQDLNQPKSEEPKGRAAKKSQPSSNSPTAKTVTNPVVSGDNR